ncbi:MAG: hypothetical protein WC712_01045 [Candidatus Brocadiia bacterium]
MTDDKSVEGSDFIRKHLRWGWVFALALGVGMLAGAIGGFIQLPQQVYSYNKALEKAGLYEFYYNDYLVNPEKFRDENSLTREDRDKIATLRAIGKEKAPGAFSVLIMMLIGLVLIFAFAFRLAGIYNTRLSALEAAVKPAEPPATDAGAPQETKPV